ncbi:uncharacterized protein LOC121865899 [Homarus americanus]|uniref:uncharacterized protein LOC121865899 n=1 Tax=Homarus americanus TaxID=6706 RepID=UPI001C46B860|nr:uncharacterized protein LOC121865899 [Homarus americanus]
MNSILELEGGSKCRGGWSMTPVVAYERGASHLDLHPREPLQDYFRPSRNASHYEGHVSPRRRSYQDESSNYFVRTGRSSARSHDPPRRAKSSVALRPSEFLRARDFRETLNSCGREGDDSWAWEPFSVREALEGPHVPFRFCPSLAACHIPRASVRISRKSSSRYTIVFDFHALKPTIAFDFHALKPTIAFAFHEIKPTIAFDFHALKPTIAFDFHALKPTIAFAFHAVKPAFEFDFHEITPAIVIDFHAVKPSST